MGYLQKKQNKYNAKSKIYNGKAYHSKKEAAYAQELDIRKQAGDIKGWKGQRKIEIWVNGVRICNYYIDFEVTHNDDSIELVEVKGFETDLWRLKWKLCMALKDEIEPGAEWTVVK